MLLASVQSSVKPQYHYGGTKMHACLCCHNEKHYSSTVKQSIQLAIGVNRNEYCLGPLVGYYNGSIQNDLEKKACDLMNSSNTVIMYCYVVIKRLSCKSAREDLVNIYLYARQIIS